MSSASPDRWDRTQTLLRGLRNSGLCIMYHGPDLAVRIVENAPSSWPVASQIYALGDEAIFGPEVAARVLKAKQEVLATAVPTRMEVARHEFGQDARWFELNIEPDQEVSSDPGHEDEVKLGPVRGLFVSAIDITDHKSREEALRTLLFEVNHRSRNLLAILQSVLGHTARTTDSVAEFERKFRGRLASLAHSQDLVTRSNWQGVRFHRLVLNQVAGHLGKGLAPPLITGPDPAVGPNTTLHLGLALHELITNSATFGAVSQGSANIVLDMEATGDGYAMTWTEHLRAPRDDPAGSGFGRAILSHIVPRALNGAAELDIAPDEVRYRVAWPESVMT